MTDAVAQVCPINPVIDLVFSRWTTPILWVLERDGLVIRTYHAEIPPRVEYEISGLGRTLTPLFSAITDWSAAHLPAVSAARQAYDAARAEEEAWAEG
ncbi:winged helix-turn-helix transcriptional regulator [Streptomyces nigrescens]|uniref:winged helix-turn-helix transcriptional regulator n=1 Tax=Streptomyces nigrescens TaxID=1920 RepID=UPI0022590211|nr:helix-turn-helix domain-containing protein [Streptomyces libani]MCX5449401.1 helix-turn-helix domain-containing protein [Streptomyces libani]